MSMEEIGARLELVRQELPLELLQHAVERLDGVEAQYQSALAGSNAEIAGHVRDGLVQVRHSLREASNVLRTISEDTVQYLAAVGVGSAVELAVPVSSAGNPGETVRAASAGGISFNELNHGKPHTVARTEINKKLYEIARTDLGIAEIRRAPVPDDKVDWDTPLPDYSPPFVDIPRGLSSARKPDDRPDPADPREASPRASLFDDTIRRDSDGRPLNPAGRTGMAGRGMLNKWGENAAADLILTRDNPETGETEVVAVQRIDTGEWALPGGKNDEGETLRQTAAREFREEAGGEGLDLDIDNAREVYAGYRDDSRNTDNAWMSAAAYHRHLSPEEAARLQLNPSSDAQAAAWVPVPAVSFGGHSQIVQRAVDLHRTEG